MSTVPRLQPWVSIDVDEVSCSLAASLSSEMLVHHERACSRDQQVRVKSACPDLAATRDAGFAAISSTAVQGAREPGARNARRLRA